MPAEVTAFEGDFLVGAWMIRKNLAGLGRLGGRASGLRPGGWFGWTSPVASDAWYDGLTNSVVIPLGYLQVWIRYAFKEKKTERY